MTKQFTRRHWGREVGSAYREATSMFRGASGDYSMLRWMLGASLVAFLMNFPTAAEWSEWNVKALAVILLALVLDTLVAKIPLGDMLDALRSVSLSLAAKGVAAVGSVVTSVSKETETVVTKGPATSMSDGAAYPPDKWGEVEK